MKGILISIGLLFAVCVGYGQNLYSSATVSGDTAFVYEEAIYSVTKLTDSTARVSYYGFNLEAKSVEVADSLIGILVATDRIIANADSSAAYNTKFISTVTRLTDSTSVIIYNRPNAPNREIPLSEGATPFKARVNGL